MYLVGRGGYTGKKDLTEQATTELVATNWGPENMQVAAEIYDGLPENSVLRALAPKELDLLLEYAVRRKVGRGEVLFDKDDPGDSLIVVLSGTLKACAWSSNGREVVFDYIGVGGIVGELTVLDGRPRAARVVAVEEAELVVIQRRYVLPYLERHWHVAIKVIETLCQKLRQSSVLLEDSAGLAMGPKLARGLLRLAEEGTGSESGHKLNLRFPINQSDLGSYVSLSRENVNRQLKEWELDGYVELGRGRIAILDPEALDEIANPEH